MFTEDLPIMKKMEELMAMWSDCVVLLPKLYKYTYGQRMIDILLDMMELIVFANEDISGRKEHLEKFLARFALFKMLSRMLNNKQVLSVKQSANLSRVCSVIGKQATGWKKSMGSDNQARPSTECDGSQRSSYKRFC